MSASTLAELSDVDVLEAFTNFPAPLILLNRDGGAARGNLQFQERFCLDSLEATQLAELVHAPQGGWQKARLAQPSGEIVDVRVRLARTEHNVLVFVGQSDASVPDVELEHLRKRMKDLERLATTDYLTGAWNRAHLGQVIEVELARCKEGRMPLSMVLLDIDHFKRINDSLGHLAGDQVLCELVKLLRSVVRVTDLIFRWGGEEFVVLLSPAGHRRAALVAENLRNAVAGHAFTGAGTVTISLGVAEHDSDEDPAAWFRRLDAALYEAKRDGRNRVAVAPGGNSDVWGAHATSVLELVWSEAFECGDPTIDGEHREMFRLANILIEAALREDANNAIEKALGNLLAHVQRHFADEEAILERLHYDGLPEHRRAHAGLVRRAMEMAERLKTGQGGVGAIVEFLAQDVVARHLLMVDRAFFPLFSRVPSPPPAGKAMQAMSS